MAAADPSAFKSTREEEFSTERQALADAGRRLLSKGLVARTWGNLSIRVSPTHFLITPSGRNYESLAPEHMALVGLADLSWDGEMKPSSEKELHARIYRKRDDVGAVIHTHQPAASSLAAARKGFIPSVSSGDAARVGDTVPCVPYALPTTRPLAEATEKTLVRAGGQCRAMLLSNHGAVCTGGDLETALELAENLETAAESHVLERYRAFTNRPDAVPGDIGTERAGPAAAPSSAADPAFGRKIADDLCTYLRKKRPGMVYMVSESRWVMAAALRGRTVRPMLDDLAQLIGVNLPVVDPVSRGAFRRIRRILGRRGIRGRSAVLLPGIGCLCGAGDEEDAAAIAMVADKGCRVAIESTYLGGGHIINRLEALLMRIIYLAKYSKKAA